MADMKPMLIGMSDDDSAHLVALDSRGDAETNLRIAERMFPVGGVAYLCALDGVPVVLSDCNSYEYAWDPVTGEGRAEWGRLV